MKPTTRRQLMVRGGVAAGAAALPSAILATPAFAQESNETDAIERVLDLEQAAELAYSLAAEELTGEVADLLRQLGTHSGEHATALAEAVDQLGVEPESASDDPATFESLKGFDAKAGEAEQLKFFIALEEAFIPAYEAAAPDLEAPDLVVTCAQVGAAHAQALVALRLLSGASPLGVTRLPKAASSAGPEAEADSQGN